MRIWTALLAGSCAAFLSTLVGTVAFGRISSAMIERETLYDLFLLAWAIMAFLCAVPRKPLGQWLVAICTSAALLGALCLLCLPTTRDPVIPAVAAALSVLLVLLGCALGLPKGDQPSR